jgi:hypothetical protein
MCPINDILRQAIQLTVNNHLAHLLSVERPGSGIKLCIIIDIAHQSPDPEVTITLHAMGSAGAVDETLRVHTTIRHDYFADWPAWTAKAAPVIAYLTTANLTMIIPAKSTINKLSIFINSKLELSIVERLLYYLSGFSKKNKILKTVYSTTQPTEDITEFDRLYNNWNAIRHLN